MKELIGKVILESSHLKTTRVTPIYNGEDSSDVRDYKSISMLQCFSKILKSIM